ncbi:MAG: AI-2E family transporter [Desulfuromonadales bacterium]|nr:AI-2E family transporter [Desulfuromonadales bacterium]
MSTETVRHGWTRGQALLALLILIAGIAGGLSIYSSASSLIGVFREASTVLFLPLLLSLVLTFLLEPVVAFFERFTSRSGSILIVYVLLLGLLLALAVWLIPQWNAFLASLVSDFPRYTETLTAHLKNLLDSLHDRFPLVKTYDLPTRFGGWGQQLLAAVLASTPKSALRIGGLLIIVPLFTFFFLRDGRQIRRAAVSLAPNRHYEMVHDIAYLTSRQLSQFIRGRVLEAIIIGLVVTVGLSLTDIRFTAVLGLFAAVTNLIPYIGPIIGMIPGIVIAFVDFGASGQFWWVVIVYIVIAQVIIDNFILIPILISRVSNLHPLWVFLAIIVGGKLYGVIGMIIGVPIASIIKITLLEIRTYRRAFRLPEATILPERGT